jgi:hypothetical protein
MPADFTTANVGGAISAGPTFITGTVIGEVFFAIDPNAVGGSALVQNSKVAWRNNSVTDNATSCLVYGINFIDPIPSTNTISAVSDSSLDTGAYTLNILGFDGSGNPFQAGLALNGTSLVTTGASFGLISRYYVTNTTSGVLVSLNGNLSISSASVPMGVISSGFSGGTTEQMLGLEAVQNGSTTIATCSAMPAGVTFSAPRTSITGLLFASGGTLAFSVGTPNYQAVWRNLTIPAATLGSADNLALIIFQCNL